MPQDPEIVKRYSRADSAFSKLMAGGEFSTSLENRHIEYFISHPFNPEQLKIIAEVVESRSAYCADLKANGFSSPGGFCEQTDLIRKFLKRSEE